jgi:hypothetical protein
MSAYRRFTIFPVNTGETGFDNLLIYTYITNMYRSDNPAISIHFLLNNPDLFSEYQNRGKLFGSLSKVLPSFQCIYNFFHAGGFSDLLIFFDIKKETCSVFQNWL